MSVPGRLLLRCWPQHQGKPSPHQGIHSTSPPCARGVHSPRTKPSLPQVTAGPSRPHGPLAGGSHVLQCLPHHQAKSSPHQGSRPLPPHAKGFTMSEWGSSRHVPQGLPQHQARPSPPQGGPSDRRDVGTSIKQDLHHSGGVAESCRPVQGVCLYSSCASRLAPPCRQRPTSAPVAAMKNALVDSILRKKAARWEAS